ncbi:uncharacterized protein LOC133316100 [Gastrolobium bilobum]|uniref:uncharacterized protein LOC133316100 n=1 Tax=Gastrolobium bilobum TaxID=150636 RepID=UPI002AAFBF57|nr:uncharacterized protein LOC133316100 [Gastrolobium bilobum]
MEIWNGLRSIAERGFEKWVVMGDFNAYVEERDKQGGSEVGWGSMQDFENCLSDCGLSDLGFSGPKFTWKRGALQERIDRLVVNDDWFLPIILKDASGDFCSGEIKPFRFLATWLTNESFSGIVNKCWNRNKNWIPAKNEFHKEAAAWHQHIFKKDQRRKYQIQRRLRGVDNQLNGGPNESLERLHRELWNSRFFHTATVARTRKNKVTALKNERGEWVQDQEALKDMVVGFFKNLYGGDDHCNQKLNTENLFPVLDDQKWRDIGKMPMVEEIRRTIFRMQPYKAPGADGLHAIFFQTQWDKVGSSVTNLVVEVFNDPVMKVSGINQSLVCLIPKVENPEVINLFRPINLCNVIYKVISKIITARLKDHMSSLVMPNQCSFVKGRQASDNIIISQEIFHTMRSKRGRKGWMAIKLDLEKAYDRVSWSFLEETLHLTGMSKKLVDLIMTCVSSPSMNILWNGTQTDYFSPSRGIRQGDPFSPYLFVLCIERLGHLINSAVERKEWHPVKMGRNGAPISHLFFADDLLIFSEASEDQANLIGNILDQYCCASGQKISNSKTRCFFSKNVNHNRRRELSQSLNFAVTADLGKYLGIPIFHKRVNKNTFRFILDKTNKKLNAWKEKCLSLAGRVVLTKVVLSALPTYAMQTSLIPIGTCEAVEQKMRSFIWGSNKEKRKIYASPWSVVCKAKKNGGLGIRNLRLANKACLMKIGHGLMTQREDLWVQVLKNKYKVKAGLLPNIPKKSICSNLWLGISKVWQKVYEGSKMMVGNGLGISFWCDKWLPIGPLLNHTIQDIPLGMQEEFSQLVTQEAVNLIAGVCPPSPEEDEDRIIWEVSQDGSFSIKSAFNMLCREESNTLQVDWNSVWEWGGPPRAKTFLWLLLGENLLTNSRRVQRHLASSNLCPRCHIDPEECIHVMRDCSWSEKIWKSLIEPDKWTEFFSLHLQNWLYINLDPKKCLLGGVKGNILFGIICWFIWKEINNFIFEGEIPSEGNTVRQACTYFTNFLDANSLYNRTGLLNRRKEEILVHWTPPPMGCVKVNTDGSSKSGNIQGGCGGSLRDVSGLWLKGFAKRLGACNSMKAENWGMLLGLQMAWDLGHRRVIIEGDSQAALNLINEGVAGNHPLAGLIRRIGQIRSWDWQVEFKHVNREGNGVADWLTNFACSLGWEAVFLDHRPEGCAKLVFNGEPPPPVLADLAAMDDEAEFSGILDIFVHHARNIHNICIYDDQDVYAKFSLTYNPDETLSTRIINRGGKNLTFNENLRMKITRMDGVLKCEIQMFGRARNPMEDQLLGFALVLISQVVGKGKVTEDYNLSSTDLFHSPAGTVQLTLSLDTSLDINSTMNLIYESANSSSISTEVILLDRKISEYYD